MIIYLFILCFITLSSPQIISRLIYPRGNQNRPSLAFLLLCEPDKSCVQETTRNAITKCMEKGGSNGALQIFNQCTASGTLVCVDRESTRRIISCLRLNSSPGIFITKDSQICVRNAVSLGTLDCFRALQKLRRRHKGFRWSTTKSPFNTNNSNNNGDMSTMNLSSSSKNSTKSSPDLMKESQANNDSYLDVLTDFE